MDARERLRQRARRRRPAHQPPIPQLSEAQEVLAGARRLAAARDARRVPLDYQALNRMIRRQRGRLTRARNSGDSEKVVLACRDTVREWDEAHAPWPDDWARWQRALDDVLPWNSPVRLEDL